MIKKVIKESEIVDDMFCTDGKETQLVFENDVALHNVNIEAKGIVFKGKVKGTGYIRGHKILCEKSLDFEGDIKSLEELLIKDSAEIDGEVTAPKVIFQQSVRISRDLNCDSLDVVGNITCLSDEKVKEGTIAGNHVTKGSSAYFRHTVGKNHSCKGDHYVESDEKIKNDQMIQGDLRVVGNEEVWGNQTVKGLKRVDGFSDVKGDEKTPNVYDINSIDNMPFFKRMFFKTVNYINATWPRKIIFWVMVVWIILRISNSFFRFYPW